VGAGGAGAVGGGGGGGAGRGGAAACVTSTCVSPTRSAVERGAFAEFAETEYGIPACPCPLVCGIATHAAPVAIVHGHSRSAATRRTPFPPSAENALADVDAVIVHLLVVGSTTEVVAEVQRLAEKATIIAPITA
jgi:hypothetical protein